MYDFRCEEIILGGDFNLVLDVEKDKKGGLPKTYQNALKVINQKCGDLDLSDIWRTLHPNNHRYTWHRRKPEIHCKLDFFLISSSIVCDTNLADILPGYKTDHSMIQLTIVLHHNPRGRGLWRLNTSLLKDEEYVEQIKIVIEQTRKEYELDDTANPSLLWDVIKMKVREKSVSYAAIKSSRIRSREDILYKKIADLEKKIDENIFCTMEQMSQLQTKLNDYRNEIERIIEYRTKGAILRSKTRWHNEGEKNTKYFLNLEKRQYKQGTISRLKRNENDYVTTDKEILHECKTFYKDL